jgi:hypothetical protein
MTALQKNIAVFWFGVHCIFMINGQNMEVGRYAGHYTHFVENLDWKALLKFGISLLLWATAKLSHSHDCTFT